MEEARMTCETCQSVTTSRWHTNGTECHACYQRRWRARNLDKTRAYQRRWRSNNAEKVRDYRKRWGEANSEHEKQYRRRTHRENAPADREYQRQWRSRNRDMDREAKRRRHGAVKAAINALTPEERIERDAHREAIKGNPCHYCGRKRARMTFDHIVPLVRGGTERADNIVRACSTCNSSKGSALLSEWLNRSDCPAVGGEDD
jgi:hypothetical protein